MRHFAFVLIAMSIAPLCGTSLAAEPKPKPKPCSDAAYRQFDFWIGTWRVTAGGKYAGTNRIESILGGCALRENWEGAGGGQGTSLNFFDNTDGRWHQTWIDASGGALYLAGSFADGAMRLEGEAPASGDQPATRHRIVWTAHADGTVRQLWESQTAGSESWQVSFDGSYARVKEGG